MVTSTVRRIISDPLVLAGRWHLSGTQIAVGEVRLEQASPGATTYRYPGLSPAEVADCLAFAFPPTRESTVAMLAGVVVISCACGEDTSAVGGLSDPICCVCGRVWRVRLLLDPLHEVGTPALAGGRAADAEAVVLVAAP